MTQMRSGRAETVRKITSRVSGRASAVTTACRMRGQRPKARMKVSR
jgi:hypothetical protein